MSEIVKLEGEAFNAVKEAIEFFQEAEKKATEELRVLHKKIFDALHHHKPELDMKNNIHQIDTSNADNGTIDIVVTPKQGLSTENKTIISGPVNMGTAVTDTEAFPDATIPGASGEDTKSPNPPTPSA